jgi:chromosome segregation ATPase
MTREQAPRLGQRQRPEVPETAAEQDETIEGLAEAELADLDTQPADPVEDDATDSTDEDYQPIPWYCSPRSHDHEAGGSGSASRSDPAMVAILERLIQDQEGQEVQMQRQAQDTAAAFTQIKARQDEFQRQQLEFQRQLFEIQRQQAATQRQYLELLQHLVTVGVSPPPSVLTPALQSSGP